MNKYRKLTYGILGACALSIPFLSGCNDTANGAQKDSVENAVAVKEGTEEAGEAVKEGAEQAGEAVKEGAETASNAMTFTPEIKAAIVANPYLNDAGNMIDVDTTADAVILKGTVSSEKNKKLAEETATKVLKDKKSTLPVKNELVVKM